MTMRQLFVGSIPIETPFGIVDRNPPVFTVRNNYVLTLSQLDAALKEAYRL
jgi:hypothetical protein